MDKIHLFDIDIPGNYLIIKAKSHINNRRRLLKENKFVFSKLNIVNLDLQFAMTYDLPNSACLCLKWELNF